MKQNEHRTCNKNLFDAFKNSINGIVYAVKTQTNIKIHLIAVVAVIIIGIYFKISQVEALFVTFACSLVIVSEMLNTAIETTVDLVTDKYEEKAKIAKDVGAGAVVISAINALIVGYIVFFEKIISLF